jgi:hypothetical protein
MMSLDRGDLFLGEKFSFALDQASTSGATSSGPCRRSAGDSIPTEDLTILGVIPASFDLDSLWAPGLLKTSAFIQSIRIFMMLARWGMTNPS